MKHMLVGAAAVAAGVGALALGAQHVPALWSSLGNVVQPVTQGLSHWVGSLSTPAALTIGVPAAAGAALTGSAGLMAGAMANDSGRMSDAAHMGVVLGLVTVTGAVGAAVGGGLGYGLLRLFT